MNGNKNGFHVGKGEPQGTTAKAYVHRAALKDAGLLFRTWREVALLMFLDQRRWKPRAFRQTKSGVRIARRSVVLLEE